MNKVTAMQEAFTQHERIAHGDLDPQPVPRDCLRDVIERYEAKLDDAERPAVYHVTFRVGPMDLAGLLDMLRYDRARVVTWSDDGGGKMTVTLESPRRPSNRWASFGLTTVLDA